MIVAALLLLAALLAYMAHYLIYRLDKIEHLTLSLHHAQRRQIMASADEVLAKIKAFRDEVIPALAEQGATLDKGVEDIQKLHDLLDPNTGGGTQLDEAIALVDEVLAAFTASKDKFAALKEKIDLPEPGDAPPEG